MARGPRRRVYRAVHSMSRFGRGGTRAGGSIGRRGLVKHVRLKHGTTRGRLRGRR